MRWIEHTPTRHMFGEHMLRQVSDEWTSWAWFHGPVGRGRFQRLEDAKEAVEKAEGRKA